MPLRLRYKLAVNFRELVSESNGDGSYFSKVVFGGFTSITFFSGILLAFGKVVCAFTDLKTNRQIEIAKYVNILGINLIELV